MSTEIATKFKSTEIGLIPHGWSVCKLQENILIKGRIGWKGLKKSEYLDDGFAIINGLQFGNDEIDWKTVGRISKDRYDESPEIMLKDGDILMTKDGTIGKLAYINKLPEPATVASGVFVIRNNKNSILNQDFLFHYFHSDYFKNLVYSRIEGAVIPHLYQRDINELFVPVPPLHEQKQIAEILSAIEDKIKLNRKINFNLEKLGGLLFKQWIVDDEQKLQDGWKIGKVSDLIRVESGFPFHSSMFDENGNYKLVTIKNVQDGFFVPECTDSLSEIPSKVPTHCRLNNGDILLSLTGNVGRVCFVYGENYLLNQRVANLVPIDENNRAFTYFLFRQKDFQNTLIGISRGTAQQNLSPIETKSLEIPIPSQDMLDRFADVANPIFQKLVENYNEIKNLSTLRDLLLPRLMNGKIRVK